jgi:hypothetical protein
MYTILNFPTTLLLLSFSYLALTNPAPAPTPLTTIQISAGSDLHSIASKLSSYEAHVTTEAQFSSVISVMSTAIPASVSSLMEVNPKAVLSANFETESWYSAIPSDAKNYMSSVERAEASIMTNTKNGAVETGVPRAMVGVVGALGAAVMML